MPTNEGGKIGDINPTLDEDGNDITDYKAIALEQNGLARRYYGKYHKIKDTPKEIPPPEVKPPENKNPSELGYGEKAYLVANGIKGADEIALVKEYLANGKSLDDIPDNKYFQNDLKELRETKATKDAMPTSSKRSPSSGRDSVDYWINKGELPPTDQVQLRRDVLNARIKKETEGSKFANESVVSN